MPSRSATHLDAYKLCALSYGVDVMPFRGVVLMSEVFWLCFPLLEVGCQISPHLKSPFSIPEFFPCCFGFTYGSPQDSVSSRG